MCFSLGAFACDRALASNAFRWQELAFTKENSTVIPQRGLRGGSFFVSYPEAAARKPSHIYGDSESSITIATIRKVNVTYFF